METHSSIFSWRIPGTEEPGGLPSVGLHACIGEGNGNPLQYSCLENPRDGGAWWAAISGVTQSRILRKRLSSSSSQLFYVYKYRTHTKAMEWETRGQGTPHPLL